MSCLPTMLDKLVLDGLGPGPLVSLQVWEDIKACVREGAYFRKIAVT